MQVVPITRPSLRDGLTAYTVLPGAEFLLAFLTPQISDAVRPVGFADISARSLAVATTAWTTRFCRTHVRLMPQGLAAVCTRAARMLAKRTLSAAHPHVVSGSQGLPALPALLVPTLPRLPQARLAISDDVRSPLKDGPGWAMHTINPNFWKEEYF
jgi:hypothetical protein